MVHLLALRRAELHLSNQVRGRAGFHALRFLAWPRKLQREGRAQARKDEYGWRKIGQATGETRWTRNGKGPARTGRSRAPLEAHGLYLLERRGFEFRRAR